MPAHRVGIAPVTNCDGRELIEANLASRLWHGQWVAPFTDEAGFLAWRRQDKAAVCSLVARKHQSREIVGVFNFNQIARGNFQSAYLGFYGMARFAKQGLMTEALRLVIDYAFIELGLHRIEANIQPSNTRSIALVQRVGFSREGYSPQYLKIDGAWRDHERWALIDQGRTQP